MSENFEVRWQVHSLDTVFKFFVDHYDFPKDEEVWSWDAFYDLQRGNVAFKLMVKSPTPPVEHEKEDVK